MQELFTYLSRLTVPDLILCAAAIVILDLFAFAVILAGEQGKQTLQKTLGKSRRKYGTAHEREKCRGQC